MSCNCNNGVCSLPSQKYNNKLQYGFVEKRNEDCDCKNEGMRIINIDENNLYPEDGIYLNNDVLYLTLCKGYYYNINFKFANIKGIVPIVKQEQNINYYNEFKFCIHSNKDTFIKIDDKYSQLSKFDLEEKDDIEQDNKDFIIGNYLKITANNFYEFTINENNNTIEYKSTVIQGVLALKEVVDINTLDYSEDGESCDIYLSHHNVYNIIHKNIDGFLIWLIFNNDDVNKYDAEYKISIRCEASEIELIFNKEIVWVDEDAPILENGYTYDIVVRVSNNRWIGSYIKYQNN